MARQRTAWPSSYHLSSFASKPSFSRICITPSTLSRTRLFPAPASRRSFFLALGTPPGGPMSRSCRPGFASPTAWWPSQKSAFHCRTAQKEPRIPDCTRSGRNKQRPDAVSGGDGRLQATANRPPRSSTNLWRWPKHGDVSWRHLSQVSRWPRWLQPRHSLGPPRGLPRKPSSFSRLINNFVSPDEPTSVTGGDTLFGSGIAALKRPHVIEDRSDYDLNLRRHDWRFGLAQCASVTCWSNSNARRQAPAASTPSMASCTSLWMYFGRTRC